MSTRTSFISTLLHKKKQVADTKRIAAARVSAAKYGKMLSPTPVGEATDIFSIPTTGTYMEGLEPPEIAPIINQEGNVSEHADGTFSVTEEDGYVHTGLNEKTARSYGAYTIAKDKAIREDAPDPYSVGDVANKLFQGVVNLGGIGYTGFVGTGQTLRHQIDAYNINPTRTPVVEPGRDYIGQRNPKITEEDESRFRNLEQLPPKIQKLYRQSLKYKILSELQRRADETKENLAVAEKRVENVLEEIPVDKSIEVARDARFKFVAETDGLWEATKQTIQDDWTSYLYGGVEAIPYMAVLATGNVPAITSLVTSMAIGNNVENTKEFLRLNDGVEPTQDEAARIQLFSVTQAAVDAIGDRLAVAGLPKAVRAALLKQFTSAKKVLASTAKSVPSAFKSSATKILAKVATAPARMIVAEAPAGIAEETSRQIATEGTVSDPAAIAQAGIIEGLAAPVAAPAVRVGAAVGRGIKNKVKSEKVDTPETQEGVVGVDALTDDSDTESPPPRYSDSEFTTIIESIENKTQTEALRILNDLVDVELTDKQKEVHLKKIREFTKKSKDAADNANPTEDESLGSLENFDDLTLVDLERFNKELEGRSDSDQEVIKALSNLQEQKERAKANTDDVAKEIREGTDAGWKGADTFFSRIKDLVQEMVSAPNPDLIEKRILTEENKLQTHAGNLERKKEAFTEVNAVINGTRKRPVNLALNNEITGEDGTVKPRVGTGGAGSDAIVIGVTPGGPGTGTIYTVYYNQSESEIKHAKAKHNTSEANYVTEVSRLRSGKSSIDRLTEIVTTDSDYVNSVSTAATAYLKSELYSNAKNEVEELRNNQIEIARIEKEAAKQDTTTIEATPEEIDAIDQETAQIAADTKEIDKGNETTLAEENITEEAATTTEALTKGSSAEIQAQIDALAIELEKAKAREEAEAAVTEETVEKEMVTVYLPDGTPVEVEVTERSKAGTVNIIDPDTGENVIVNEEKYSFQDPTNPDFKMNDLEFTPAVSTLSDSNIEILLKREEEKIEKQEEKGQSPLTFLRNRNALRMEQKRREEDTVVTEPVSEDTDTTATEKTAETTEEELTTYNNIKVIADDNIITAEETKGAAQYDRKNKIIRLDRNFLRTKFAEKAWTNARELIEDIDGEKIKSKAENLPADAFKTYNEFEKFVIEHEYQHSLYSREDFNNDFPNGTKGEYETAINNRALAAIQQSLQESTEVSYKLDGSNLRLLESELDVHTLSVIFPAAINADGTVKTGEAANAAIGKLGKFLKVCS